MKRIVIIICLIAAHFGGLSQETLTEKQLIEKTIGLSFDGWATGDTVKVSKAMHASCHLKNYRDGKFMAYTKGEYLALFKPHPRPVNLETRIVTLDVTNNIGSAKVEIEMEKDLFTDYFNLMKTGDGWQIVDKVSTRTSKIAGGNNAAAARKIDSLFAPYNRQTPGAAIAVIKDGKVIYRKGYGMANLEHNVPITTETVFNIASVSKQFTAFAIYLLVEEGRISLEDDVRKYITELPDYGKVIKVKHLLAHTSGLRDQAALGSLAGNRGGDVVTTEQVMKLVSRQKSLNFLPGNAFGYCNTGYTLLAEIIERVTGKTFAAYTNDKIFQPLGMTSTRFNDNHEMVVKNMAASYELINGQYNHKPLNTSNPGPSNLLTTVDDLVKWQMNFEEPVVGNAAMIKAFNEVSYLDNGQKVVLRVLGPGDTVFHAKGQNLSNYNGIPMITHGGHTAGFRTFMGRFPAERLSIIALSNDEHNERLNARWQIADFYLKEKMVEEMTPPAGPKPTATPVAVFRTQLKDFTGRFRSEELATDYTFEVRGDALIMKHVRLDDIRLARSGENTFSGSGAETFAFEITFHRDQNKRVTGFSISNFGVKGLRFDALFVRHEQRRRDTNNGGRIEAEAIATRTAEW